MKKKEPDKAPPPPPELPLYWIETSEAVSYRCEFEPHGQLSVSSLLCTNWYMSCVFISGFWVGSSLV